MTPDINNLLCKCGHKRSDHAYSLSRFLNNPCAVKDITGKRFYEDECGKFIQDNLKYLEMLYDQKANRTKTI